MVDKQDVLKLMDEAETVYLATIGKKGPCIRALVNLRRADLYPDASRLCRAAGFTVYLSTSRGSGKVRDVTFNPRVALYYCDPKTYHGAMISGRAELLDDPGLKKSLWSPDWSIYWPAGASDPDYVVVRVIAEEVSGWWGEKPFRLELAAQ